MSAAVEQSRRKANMAAQGKREIRPLRLTPQFLQAKKKNQTTLTGSGFHDHGFGIDRSVLAKTPFILKVLPAPRLGDSPTMMASFTLWKPPSMFLFSSRLLRESAKRKLSRSAVVERILTLRFLFLNPKTTKQE